MRIFKVQRNFQNYLDLGGKRIDFLEKKVSELYFSFFEDGLNGIDNSEFQVQATLQVFK